MSCNQTNTYDYDSHIAEVYDQHETQTQDVELIRRLVQGLGKLRILEPFCGTGRILIPLAQDGHELVGLDQARPMLDRCRKKMAELPADVRRRITLIEADVTAGRWPESFDLVVMGNNCFYELATPEEQKGCIASASRALKPGGYLYLDNNHMEGDLDESWRGSGIHEHTGTCEDGTRFEGTQETIWYDAPRRLWRCRRTVTITSPDGTVAKKEWIQQKHPVSVVEQREWLDAHGFAIEQLYGDRDGNPYTEASGHAIFWARKV